MDFAMTTITCKDRVGLPTGIASRTIERTTGEE
jgi:hypothetical protein